MLRPWVVTITPCSTNRSTASTDATSSPPGLPRTSTIRLRMPSRCEFPQCGVQIAGGGLLEAGQLEIADAVFAVDYAHLIDAGHVDAPPANVHLPLLTVRAHDGQRRKASLDALQQVGGLIGGHRGGGLSIDGDDAVAGAHARLLGGAAGNHPDDGQGVGLNLQLDPQADEVALDLGIDFI